MRGVSTRQQQPARVAGARAAGVAEAVCDTRVCETGVCETGVCDTGVCDTGGPSFSAHHLGVVGFEDHALL